MLENDHIICVYNYLKLSLEEKEGNGQLGYAYYILYLLDSSGPVERELVSKLYFDRYKESPNIGNRYIGPFRDLDEIGQFAFQVCEELNGAKVFLVSPEEYANFLEESSDIKSLAQALTSQGNNIENIDKTSSRNSIFGKLFS